MSDGGEKRVERRISIAECRLRTAGHFRGIFRKLV